MLTNIPQGDNIGLWKTNPQNQSNKELQVILIGNLTTKG